MVFIGCLTQNGASEFCKIQCAKLNPINPFKFWRAKPTLA